MTILYCPELGQKKPETLFESRLSHYGTHYFVRTPCTLRGRGVEYLDTQEGINRYQLTVRAYESLETHVNIAMKEYLD